MKSKLILTYVNFSDGEERLSARLLIVSVICTRFSFVQACPTNPSRSRNRAILNCAILSIVSQLVSIEWKVGLDSEITIICYLHLCHSVFISFPIMFIAQSVRSQLISFAPINTAFWYCCLLCFPHLLRFRMRVIVLALIYSRPERRRPTCARCAIRSPTSRA